MTEPTTPAAPAASVQSIVVLVSVPDDQATAAESAAAAFVSDLPDNVSGALVLSATYGGTSLLPSAQDALDAALDALRALSTKSPKPTAEEITAAADKVDAAVKVYEASLTTAAPAQATAPAAAPAPLDQHTVAQTVPAPTGAEPAPTDAAAAPAA